jgi:hypothetical protein
MIHVALDLEARQHVAVGQTKERVRVTEAADSAEAGVDPRMKRIADVHHHRTACHVVVSEQQPGLGHPVFGMVDLLGADAGCR